MTSLALRLPRLLVQLPQRFCSSSTASTDPPTIAKTQQNVVAKEEDPDAPIPMVKNPYYKPEDKCLLCRHEIKLDYKNTRLLQQFVSSFSGRVYEQHITGLCDKQYRTLLSTIKYSRKAGYMPVMTKDPKYLRDPKLFDPMHPSKPHSYA